MRINNYIILVSASICLILLEGPPAVSSININYNRGRAQAFGQNGASISDAETHGVQATIRRKDGTYEPVYHQSGGRSNTFSTGSQAPNTWASGNTQFSPEQSRGRSGAGFDGGSGNAQTFSHSRQIVVPLDNEGTTLYHNIKPKKRPATSESDV